MKTAEQLFPEYWEREKVNGRFYGPCDYNTIIEEIGNVLIQIDDDDYQGDTRVLLEKDGKYGYLIFGWGSCSGCDQLQGCETIKEIQDVIDDMVKDTLWFDSLDLLKKHFSERDWELQYCYHQSKTKEFIDKVLNFNL